MKLEKRPRFLELPKPSWGTRRVRLRLALGRRRVKKKSDTSKDGKARRVRRPKAQKDESKSLSALTLSFGPRKRHVVVGAAHS